MKRTFIQKFFFLCGYVPEESVKPIDVDSLSKDELFELHHKVSFRLQRFASESLNNLLKKFSEQPEGHERVYYHREESYAVSSCESCMKNTIDISANFEIGDILPLLVKNIEGVEKVTTNIVSLFAQVAVGCDIKVVGNKIADCVRDYVKDRVQ